MFREDTKSEYWNLNTVVVVPVVGEDNSFVVVPSSCNENESVGVNKFEIDVVGGLPLVSYVKLEQ